MDNSFSVLFLGSWGRLHIIFRNIITGYLHNFFLQRSFRTTLPQKENTPKLFVQTQRGQELLTRVRHFMKQHILPAEKVKCV